jgi:hypothetical protein
MIEPPAPVVVDPLVVTSVEPPAPLAPDVPVDSNLDALLAVLHATQQKNHAEKYLRIAVLTWASRERACRTGRQVPAGRTRGKPIRFARSISK